MAKEHAANFLRVLSGGGFSKPDPRPMFPSPPGLLRLEPHSPGLRNRIWWGAGTRATAEWTSRQGMNLMSSTLLTEDTGVSLGELQAEQIQIFRDEWAAAGHDWTPRVSISRSIIPITTDQDRAFFGRGGPGHESEDQVGYLDANTLARFGRSYIGEPDVIAAEPVLTVAPAAAH